ncbi:LysR substrate-binding domain-containing protein [Polynucleobacter necessarius]|uniref:LysR substrate-binding domain-containing protein n=1 Tax=Polynucleobacter necessarius TaxID=576610 RepID=UPI001E4984F5|nr:LysR substrate-binding domain-containing protein [Polynucleobacter necessarius]
MRLRIQVRSYDAMCQMIAVNLGIGVLPIQACAAQIKAMGLKTVLLEDPWAKRNLLVATKAGINHSPATTLFSQHFLRQ